MQQSMTIQQLNRLVKYICNLVEKGKGITAWLSLACCANSSQLAVLGNLCSPTKRQILRSV
jgi:hypothetical protein